MPSRHPHSSPFRTYRREKAFCKNEQILQVILEETDLRIVLSAQADTVTMRDELMARVASLRGELTLWITLHLSLFRCGLLLWFAPCMPLPLV